MLCDEGVRAEHIVQIHHIHLGILTKIFQAKVHTIETCVRLMEEQQSARKTIKILSDSQVALKALECSHYNS